MDSYKYKRRDDTDKCRRYYSRRNRSKVRRFRRNRSSDHSPYSRGRYCSKSPKVYRNNNTYWRKSGRRSRSKDRRSRSRDRGRSSSKSRRRYSRSPRRSRSREKAKRYFKIKRTPSSRSDERSYHKKKRSQSRDNLRESTRLDRNSDRTKKVKKWLDLGTDLSSVSPLTNSPCVIEIDSVEGGSPYSLTLTSSHEWRKEVGLSLNSSLSFDLSSEDKTPQNDEEKIKESCSSQQKPTRKQKEVVTSEDKGEECKNSEPTESTSEQTYRASEQTDLDKCGNAGTDLPLEETDKSEATGTSCGLPETSQSEETVADFLPEAEDTNCGPDVEVVAEKKPEVPQDKNDLDKTVYCLDESVVVVESKEPPANANKNKSEDGTEGRLRVLAPSEVNSLPEMQRDFEMSLLEITEELTSCRSEACALPYGLIVDPCLEVFSRRKGKEEVILRVETAIKSLNDVGYNAPTGARFILRPEHFVPSASENKSPLWKYRQTMEFVTPNAEVDKNPVTFDFRIEEIKTQPQAEVQETEKDCSKEVNAYLKDLLTRTTKLLEKRNSEMHAAKSTIHSRDLEIERLEKGLFDKNVRKKK